MDRTAWSGTIASISAWPARAISSAGTIVERQAVLLKHAARASIQVKFGHRAVAIDLDASGRAVARFENGESIRPDLLIGADGRMDSVARRFVAGDNTPIYQGFVNWIGVAQGNGTLVSDIEIQDYWGSGDRFGCVAVWKDLVYWAAAQTRAMSCGRWPSPCRSVRELLV